MPIEYPNFEYKVTYRDPKSRARLGYIKTPHGVIETPNFIFCGTKAAVKAIEPHEMRAAGTQIILSNTYHLMIQPTAEMIQHHGGLHNFMKWDGPMMTDSGGFQIFSMGHGSVADEIKGRNRGGRERSLLGVTEEGARFRSYSNGEILNLTPESSIDMQRKIGADLIYQFDENTAYNDTRDYTAMSTDRSLRWGDRCLEEFKKGHDGRQVLYGIMQGGIHEDLRRISASGIESQDFFGSAVGGCYGGSEEEMVDVISYALQLLTKERPVHLLGIGRIQDIFTFVRYGVETFDCVVPTRMARHGWALGKGVPSGRMNLRNAQYALDQTPLDEYSPLALSRTYSRGYLHHLIKANESLAGKILTLHNVAVMNRLMAEIRVAIKEGTLDQLEKEWIFD